MTVGRTIKHWARGLGMKASFTQGFEKKVRDLGHSPILYRGAEITMENWVKFEIAFQLDHFVVLLTQGKSPEAAFAEAFEQDQASNSGQGSPE